MKIKFKEKTKRHMVVKLSEKDSRALLSEIVDAIDGWNNANEGDSLPAHMCFPALDRLANKLRDL